MSKTVTVQLTTIGANAGPFDIYSNADLYATAVATGITAATIQTGYNVTVPDATTIISVVSTGACENDVFIPISGSISGSCGSTQQLSWATGSTTGSSVLFNLGTGYGVSNLVYNVASGAAAFQVTYGDVTQVLTGIVTGTGSVPFNYVYDATQTSLVQVSYALRGNNNTNQSASVRLTCPTASTDITTTTTTVFTGSCICPDGTTANSDGTKCLQTITVAPSLVVGQASLTTFTGQSLKDYGEFGYRVYNINDYNQSGASVSGLYAAVGGQSGPFIGGFTQNLLASRMNAAGIWAANIYWPGAELQWDGVPGTLGLCTTIQVPTSKIYYVGLGGDNVGNFKVNGQPVVDQPFGRIQANFKYWHIYPVYLSAGPNIIELQNTNLNQYGTFAGEIYNVTLNQLVTATQESDLNIIFTTKTYRQGQVNQNSPFCTSYNCPVG